MPTEFRERRVRPQARWTTAVPNLRVQELRWLGCGRGGTDPREQARVIGGLACRMLSGGGDSALARSCAEAFTDPTAQRLQALAWRWSPAVTRRRQDLGNAAAATGDRLLLTSAAIHISVTDAATTAAAVAIHHGATSARGGRRARAGLVEGPSVTKWVLVAFLGQMAALLEGGKGDDPHGGETDGGGGLRLHTEVSVTVTTC